MLSSTPGQAPEQTTKKAQEQQPEQVEKISLSANLQSLMENDKQIIKLFNEVKKSIELHDLPHIKKTIQSCDNELEKNRNIDPFIPNEKLYKWLLHQFEMSVETKKLLFDIYSKNFSDRTNDENENSDIFAICIYKMLLETVKSTIKISHDNQYRTIRYSELIKQIIIPVMSNKDKLLNDAKVFQINLNVPDKAIEEIRFHINQAAGIINSVNTYPTALKKFQALTDRYQALKNRYLSASLKKQKEEKDQGKQIEFTPFENTHTARTITKLKICLLTAAIAEYDEKSNFSDQDAFDFIDYHTQDWSKFKPAKDKKTHRDIKLLPRNNSPHGRDLIITDLHGHIEFVMHLINNLGAQDRLFICGDLVDRGPDSYGIIEAIIKAKENGKQVHCIRGNHEDGILNVFNHMDYQKKLNASKKIINEWIEAGKNTSEIRNIDTLKNTASLISLKEFFVARIKNGYTPISLVPFFEDFCFALQSGALWLIALNEAQREKIKNFMNNLPYVIHVDGEFNMAHAQFPGHEAATLVLKENSSGFSEEQKYAMTWNREADLDVLVARTPFVTYLGHSPFDGDNILYSYMNAANLDLGVFMFNVLFVLNHTHKKIELLCRDKEFITGAVAYKLESIIKKIMVLWNKLDSSISILDQSHSIFDQVIITEINNQPAAQTKDTTKKRTWTTVDYDKENNPTVQVSKRTREDTAQIAQDSLATNIVAPLASSAETQQKNATGMRRTSTVTYNLNELDKATNKEPIQASEEKPKPLFFASANSGFDIPANKSNSKGIKPIPTQQNGRNITKPVSVSSSTATFYSEAGKKRNRQVFEGTQQKYYFTPIAVAKPTALS